MTATTTTDPLRRRTDETVDQWRRRVTRILPDDPRYEWVDCGETRDGARCGYWQLAINYHEGA